MGKFYLMGCYTQKGLAGFVDNPSTNRKAATQALLESGGAKLTDYSLLRGSFDFISVCEGTFEQMFKSLEKIKNLPKNTMMYCGHEYTKKNGQFCISIDKDNTKLRNRIEDVKNKTQKKLMK